LKPPKYTSICGSIQSGLQRQPRGSRAAGRNRRLDGRKPHDQIVPNVNPMPAEAAMPDIPSTITQIDASSAARTLIRGHELVTDRTVEKGGGNQGPMGGELLLASLGACFMSNLIAAFQARGLAPQGLTAEITGTLEGTPPRFQRMAVTVPTQGVDRAEMEKLVLIAERGCIVANTLKPCMPVDVTVV